MAMFRQKGELVEVTASDDIEYGALVAINDKGMIGVARKSAVSGETISCEAEGVFRLKKASGSALAAGTPVTITVATETAAATTSGGVSNGIVWKDAASADTVVDVKINVFIPVGTIQSADLSSYLTSATAAST